jgi:AcrR family transcriptional regulator
MPSPAEVPPPATRRRGKALEDAILDAAWEELRAGSWSTFTIDAVSARSGAAKSVIYRRWSNRVELAQAMMERLESPDERGQFVSQGTLRDDLLAYATGTSQFLVSPFGDLVRGLAAEGEPVWSAFDLASVPVPVLSMVTAAVDRGELPRMPGAISLNLGTVVVVEEFIRTREVIPPALISELVDDLWIPALERSAATS